MDASSFEETIPGDGGAIAGPAGFPVIDAEFVGDENGPFGPLDDATFLAETLQQGQRAVRDLRAFAGRLPEVARRESHLTMGRTDVHDFGARHGGMRRDHVNEVLRVDRLLRGLPKLRALLHRGEQGWSKLRAVATIARGETEDVWVEHVRGGSKRQLEFLVAAIKSGRCREVGPDGIPRDLRRELDAIADDDECDFLVSDSGVPLEGRPQRDGRPSFKFEPGTAELLLRLTQELSMKEKRKVGHDEALRRLLSGADGLGDGRLPARIVIHREEGSGQMYMRTGAGALLVSREDLDSRYRFVEEVDLVRDAPPAQQYEPRKDGRRPKVPEAIRRYVMDWKYDGRCCFPGCHRRAVALHHQDRFSILHEHNPFRIVPVCGGHHDLIHAGRVVHEDRDPRSWLVTLEPSGEGSAARVDRLVQIHRWRTCVAGEHSARREAGRDADAGGIVGAEVEGPSRPGVEGHVALPAVGKLVEREGPDSPLIPCSSDGYADVGLPQESPGPGFALVEGEGLEGRQSEERHVDDGRGLVPERLPHDEERSEEGWNAVSKAVSGAEAFEGSRGASSGGGQRGGEGHAEDGRVGKEGGNPLGKERRIHLDGEGAPGSQEGCCSTGKDQALAGECPGNDGEDPVGLLHAPFQRQRE